MAGAANAKARQDMPPTELPPASLIAEVVTPDPYPSKLGRTHYFPTTLIVLPAAPTITGVALFWRELLFV